MDASWTDVEIKKLIWIRAIEWCNWPAFISGAAVPILLLWITWWKVLVGVIIINSLWATVRHSVHNLKIANIAALLVTPGQWPVMLICTVIQGVHRHWLLAILSAAWPFVHGLISFPGGKIGLIEYNFASELGITSTEETV